MDTPQTTRLRRPAYAKALESVIGKPAADIMVEVHIGKRAWNRVKRTDLGVYGTNIEGPWWGALGVPLVVTLDAQTSVADYDFTCLDRLHLILDARDCSYEPARACARRMCEHGAATVALMHPQSRSSSGGFTGWEIFRGARR